jgi:hypothetical protein
MTRAKARLEGPLTGLVLLVLALLAYWPALGGEFLNWDDDRYFTNNPLWKGPVGAYVWAAVTRIQFQAYHPIHLLSYLPDRLLWQTHPSGFHTLNVLLFALALFWLTALLRRHVRWPAALLAVAIIGVHPLYVEPVAWITGRKEILAVLAVVAVLWFEDRSPPERKFSPLVLVLSTAAFVTKSATMVLPIFIFAWQRWVRGSSVRHALLRALPSGLLALVVGVVVTKIWSANAMIGATRPVPIWLDVPGTLSVYAARVFWPVGLSPSYPSDGPHERVGAALLWLALAGIVVGWRHLPRAARFAIVVFFGSLIPVSNIVPLYFRFADRYAAVALLGLAWPVARSLEWLAERARRGVVTFSLVIVASYAVVTHSLSRSWRDSLSLWGRAASAQPRSLFAHVKLGETLRAKAQWEAAVDAYANAIHADPHSLLGYVGLFTTLAEEAEREGRTAAGTTKRWSSQIAATFSHSQSLAALASEIDSQGCRPCARSLDWLRLVLHPLADQELLASVRSDLAAGRADRALVYLLVVVDRSSPEFRQLYREARASGRHPFRP